MTRILHGATAILCWVALAVQYALIVDALGPGLGSWRYFGYFTILTNILVAIVASAVAVRPRSTLAGPVPRYVALCAILLVGVVYAFLLSGTAVLTGWDKACDTALHKVSPVLYTLAWLSGAHGALRWRSLGWALVPPLSYVVYALLRGAFDGWYAYWFLDPTKLTPAGLAASIAGLALAFVLAATLVIGVDRLLARRFSASA